MARYVKKPIEIEARQFAGDIRARRAVAEWCGGRLRDYANILSIDTLEGVMDASRGDWIIRGVKGEFYPCKPDIFEATYDLVSDEVPPPDEAPPPDALARLRSEAQELSSRIAKLRYVLSGPADTAPVIAPRHRVLLDIQLQAMETYLAVLRARIDDLDDVWSLKEACPRVSDPLEALIVVAPADMPRELDALRRVRYIAPLEPVTGLCTRTIVWAVDDEAYVAGQDWARKALQEYKADLRCRLMPDGQLIGFD